MTNATATLPEVFDDLGYVYDGSLEGMLCAIFASYARRENPSDIMPKGMFSARLSQRISYIETDFAIAKRVRSGIIEKCGRRAWRSILKASLSSAPDAASYAYRFVRFCFDDHAKDCRLCKAKGCSEYQKDSLCPKKARRAINDISHPCVEPLFRIARAVDQETEHIRQFARFEHIADENMDIWYSRINPRDSVVPLVMSHFIERFNIQPFVIYDEVHNLAGLYDGKGYNLIVPNEDAAIKTLKSHSATEIEIQNAWKRFYQVLSIDERYNPELRRNFMPVRFWKNITELKDTPPGIGKI